MRGLLVAFLLIATMMSGCSDSSGKLAGNEIIIESTLPAEISSNQTQTKAPTAQAKGHLAGVVVDQAIRPLQGVVVKLPGLDRKHVTDRTGEFGFVDLMPGSYFIKIEHQGYYGAEAVIEVAADKFSRAKVILERIPPPTPRHETIQFDGFAQMSGDPLFGLAWGCTCQFNGYIEPEGLNALVLEATMSSYGGASSGTNSFYHLFRDYAGKKTFSSGAQPNPMRTEVRDDFATMTDNRYRITMTPEGFPAPELNKKFQVYLTSFYYSVPPTGWSFVRGDA